ncbi:MAG: acyl-CoA dehydrogenase family protein [Tetrasphaera sp.]
MEFALSPRAADLSARVRRFVDTRIEPFEAAMLTDVAERRARGEDPWPPPPQLEELKAAARAEGLWNLFLPAGHEGSYAEKYGTDGGVGLSNTDYASIAEQMGRSFIAPLIFNCNAPDTGNMEVLLKYGSPEQKDAWLDPLLDGRIRSTFLMTEPGVASSDATTMEATATIDGDKVMLNGRKWWSSGAGHPDCKVGIFMAVTDPDAARHQRHSMVLVPMDAPGVTVERMLSTMGVYDEPLGHGEVSLTNVRLPVENILAGPGRAFEIAQGRLGPGRVHHCMRLIGLCEKVIELALERSTSRVAFGRPIVQLGGNRERLAKARIAVNQARLHVLYAAWRLDTVGPVEAFSEISEIKAAVPQMACDVIDMAIQLHGGAGTSTDFPLATAYSLARSLRFADGPDEVHLAVISRLMLRPYAARARGSALPASAVSAADRAVPAATERS